MAEETEDDFTVTAEQGGSFEPAPAGMHIALCSHVIVLGDVDTVYKGHTKRKHLVKIGFELTNTKRVLEDGTEVPFVVFKDYTLKMYSGKGLQKMLEEWRGESFTKEETKTFNIGSILGLPCMVNVVQKVSESNGNKYSNVASIGNLPEGIEPPVSKLGLKKFRWKAPYKENFMSKEFNELPEWMQKIIESSDQYKEMMDGAPAQTATTTTANSTPPATTATAKKRPF